MKYQIIKKDDVDFIEIDNENNLKVTLCSCAASIYRIVFKDKEMVLTPKNVKTFLTSGKYYGKTVGRIAGRVPNGQIEIDGIIYQLDQNEGTNCLHGGKNGISFRNYQYEIKEEDEFKVKFTLETKNFEEGFPGNACYEVEYIFSNDDSFRMNYHVISSSNSYFNLTNHTYFLLGEKNILNHQLTMESKEVSIFDENDFSIKDFNHIEKGSLFDFSSGVTLKDILDQPELHSLKWLNGLDYRFIFDNTKEVTLSSKEATLTISTSLPAVHIYSNGFKSKDEYIDGSKDEVSKALALEFSYPYPLYTKENEQYSATVRYSFK